MATTLETWYCKEVLYLLPWMWWTKCHRSHKTDKTVLLLYSDSKWEDKTTVTLKQPILLYYNRCATAVSQLMDRNLNRQTDRQHSAQPQVSVCHARQLLFTYPFLLYPGWNTINNTLSPITQCTALAHTLTNHLCHPSPSTKMLSWYNILITKTWFLPQPQATPYHNHRSPAPMEICHFQLQWNLSSWPPS